MKDLMLEEAIGFKGGGNSLSTYEQFLLTEYNNIAQAHFNTKSAIAAFFKHYLLIVSLPISISLVIFGKEQINVSRQYLDIIISFIPIIFIAISIVGVLVMLYIINLDCDAILYARTVNGIRNYFVKRSGIDSKILKDIITLPIDIKKPRYGGFHSLSFVIIAFALLNTLYFYVGLSVRYGSNTFYNGSVNLASFSVFVLHFIIARYYINYLEKSHSALPAKL